MDSQRFDTLTRTFATSSSRRAALKAVVGGALAGLTGAMISAGEAGAAEAHVCCIYECTTDPTRPRFKHVCKPPGRQCLFFEGDCRVVSADVVTKCSACGDLSG